MFLVCSLIKLGDFSVKPLTSVGIPLKDYCRKFQISDGLQEMVLVLGGANT